MYPYTANYSIPTMNNPPRIETLASVFELR